MVRIHYTALCQRVRVVKEAVLKIVCQKWLVGSNPTVGALSLNNRLFVELQIGGRRLFVWIVVALYRLTKNSCVVESAVLKAHGVVWIGEVRLLWQLFYQ